MTATTKPVDLEIYVERLRSSGWPALALELEEKEKAIAELIAADVEYDRLRLIWLGSKQLEDFHRFDLVSERRAAALTAIQGGISPRDMEEQVRLSQEIIGELIEEERAAIQGENVGGEG